MNMRAGMRAQRGRTVLVPGIGEGGLRGSVRGLLSLVLLGALPCVAACGDEGPPMAQLIPEALSPDEDALDHYAQIRIRVEDLQHPDRSPQLTVDAKFASFFGMDTSFARGRANMLTPAVDLLAPGTCRARAELVRIEQELAGKPIPPALRELSLVDAGQLELSFGGQEVTVPYALVPELVSWMTGLEYHWHDSGEGALRVDPTGQTPIRLSWSGSLDAGLPAHAIEVRLPPAIRGLEARLVDPAQLPALDSNAFDAATLDPNEGTALGPAVPAVAEVQLTWQEARTFSWPIVLAFHADGQPSASDQTVLCAVDDTGKARLPAADLARAGVNFEAPVHVSALRLSRATTSAGDFHEIDLVLESREEVMLARTLAH